MSIPPSQAEALPRWNLDSLYPGPQSPELLAVMAAVSAAIAELEESIEALLRKASGKADALEAIITSYNAALAEAKGIEGYLYCLTAADVTDEAASAASSAWDLVKARFARIPPRFIALLDGRDLAELGDQSPVIQAHLPALLRAQTANSHLMPTGEEDLAAALGPSGASGWSAMRDALAGRATVRLIIEGEEQELPLSEAENLAFSAERELRAQAYEATNAAWDVLGVPLAAALNGVKSEQLVLATRRKWADPLQQALVDNAIDRPILNAMHTAVHEAFPEYRRYLQAKARALGVPVLAGYDMFAPVGETMPWPYDVSREFITATFAAEHPPLAALAERAFAKNWIDAETREGKDGGGFSCEVGAGESRIFVNYLPVYDQMSVLAHELGHSYQIDVVAARQGTPLQNPPDEIAAPVSYPMTLAETASTFCEALVQRAARSRATPTQELAVLDSWLQAFSATIFDTHVRFLVEEEMFKRRAERELSSEELNEITRNAWCAVAGDAIAPGTTLDHRWTKPHYFISNLSYYNFPYGFGILFAAGLLAVRNSQPRNFYDRFDDLLADSGMIPAAELAARFDIDLRDPAFWRSGFAAYRVDIDRYEALLAGS